MTQRQLLNSLAQSFSTTVFAEMSQLAISTGAVNLGQGFPDRDGPAEIAEAAIAAIRNGHNQYPPGPGIPALREAIAEHQQRYWNLSPDPNDGVLVTAGATEAIAAAILSLVGEGDEVIVFEPMYDAYSALITLARGVIKPVMLSGPEFTFDKEELRSQITSRTTMILLNSPHNPTGKVFSLPELQHISEVVLEFGLVALCDEVYEHLVFDGTHRPLASLPGMFEHTLTVSSAAKTYAFTGWKVGWVSGPSNLVGAVRAVKQYLTYVNAAPMQHAIAFALGEGDRLIAPTVSDLKEGRDFLVRALSEVGLQPRTPSATYFLMSDLRALGVRSGVEFAYRLAQDQGVVVIPVKSLYVTPGAGETQIRWTFCKSPEILEEARRRLLVRSEFFLPH